MGPGYIPRQPSLLLHVSLLLLTGVAAAYDPEASITGLYTGPYFDPLTPRNLTAHLEDEAKLPCTVRQLGDKSVSWVRVRDADILTVDRYTFVGDERFESHYTAPSETWNLVIKYVQERDAGEYECQVSTEPKMSQLFSLRVVIPKVSIVPVGDRYVKAGSTVQVDCQITDVVQLPDYIFWYHEEKRVMDRRDPNLLVTVKQTDVEAITSTLTIHKVKQEQSGNYTCMPSNLHAASVTLHVLNEKHPAAMQGERNSGCTPEAHLPLTLVLLLGVLAWSIMSLGAPDSDSTNEESMTDGPITTQDSAINILSHPIVSVPSLPCPRFPSSITALPSVTDQEQQKVVELLWELLTFDALPLGQKGYKQDKDQLTRAFASTRSFTEESLALRHLEKAQVALNTVSHPSRYIINSMEARVEVLDEALAHPIMGGGFDVEYVDEMSLEDQHTWLFNAVNASTRQTQLVSSMVLVESCRTIGKILLARQR